MIGMPRLLWKDVAPFFDPETNGSLPDVRVPDTTAVDWQGLLDLVRSCGWGCEYYEGRQGLPVPLRLQSSWPAASKGLRCECGRSRR